MSLEESLRLEPTVIVRCDRRRRQPSAKGVLGGSEVWFANPSRHRGLGALRLACQIRNPSFVLFQRRGPELLAQRFDSLQQLQAENEEGSLSVGPFVVSSAEHVIDSDEEDPKGGALTVAASPTTVFDEITRHRTVVAFFVEEEAPVAFSLPFDAPPAARLVSVGPAQSPHVERAPWAPSRRPFVCAFFADRSVACLTEPHDAGRLRAFLRVATDVASSLEAAADAATAD